MAPVQERTAMRGEGSGGKQQKEVQFLVSFEINQSELSHIHRHTQSMVLTRASASGHIHFALSMNTF